MKHFIENFNITGHLEVTKVYRSGEEEVIFDDHNIIVSGMGVGLSYMFSNTGSNYLPDYRIDRFQVGVSGGPELEVSSTYELSGALDSKGKYGGKTNLNIKKATQIVNGEERNNRYFAGIGPEQISKLGETSVKFTLTLDEDSCNGETLNEIGLFMANPTGSDRDKSILVAYRHFSDTIKTSDFSLVFRWRLHIPTYIMSLIVPTYADVYFGPPSVPEEDRRQSTQKLDIYGPRRKLRNGNACVIWIHAGALTGGDKQGDLPPYVVEKLLERDIVLVSPNYAVCTKTGEPGGGVPVNYPIFTSGEGFGSTEDSNNNLVPSSIAPFRLGNGKENAFTDAVRIVQFIKHHADTYNIDKDHIVLAAGAAGADLTSWLAMAPEVSAITSDPVEAESIKVYAASNRNVISNWLTWFPYNLSQPIGFAPTPAGKTVFDMSASVYVDKGDGTTLTSSYDYPSGRYYSTAIHDLPEHLKYGLGVLFRNPYGYGFSDGPIIPPSELHDWANIKGLLGVHQHREAPALTKKFWSGYYHASAGVTETYTLDGYDDDVTLTWGKPDNSGIYLEFESTGTSTSSAGYAGVPSWRITIPNEAAGGISSDMSGFWSKGFIEQVFGNLYDVSAYQWNLLDPDASYGVASGETIAEYVSATYTDTVSLTTDSGLLDIVALFGINPIIYLVEPLHKLILDIMNLSIPIGLLDSNYVDLSGFGWGPPNTGDPDFIDRYDISGLVEKFTGTGTGQFIPNPYISIDSSADGIDTSAVGGGPVLENMNITYDTHDPIMGVEMMDAVRTNFPGGVHTASSVLNWINKTEYLNPINFYGLFEESYIKGQENVRVEWIMKILSHSYPHYGQFVGTLSTADVDVTPY